MKENEPSVPGLEDPIPASERAQKYGKPLHAVVGRIKSGIVDGVKHEGTWYVERDPYGTSRSSSDVAESDAETVDSAAQSSAPSAAKRQRTGLRKAGSDPNDSARSTRRRQPLNATLDSFRSRRPLSLTIVGWWLIVTGVMSVLGLAAVSSPAVQSSWARMGINPIMAVGNMLMTGLAYAAAGYGILQGHVWGRTLYLAVGIVSLVVSAFLFYTGLSVLLFGGAIYATIAAFLTRDVASAYFNGSYDVPAAKQRRQRALANLRAAQRNPSDLKRVFGVLFAVGAGFLLTMALFMIGFASGAVAVFLGGLFGLPALVALAIGIALWGRSRWAGMSGWTLAGVGACTMLTGLPMLFMMQTEAWQATMAQADTAAELTPDVFITISLIGLLIGLSGAGLLYLQRKKDSQAVRHHLEPEEAVESLEGI